MHTQLQNLLRQKRRWLRTFSYALEGRKQESGRGAEGVFFTFNSRRELVRNLCDCENEISDRHMLSKGPRPEPASPRWIDWCLSAFSDFGNISRPNGMVPPRPPSPLIAIVHRR